MSGEQAQPLPLPGPPNLSDNGQSALKVELDSEKGLKFEALGPIVVNSDGTMSRIANWEHMTEQEKERTMRVLVARNKIRIANQEKGAQELGPEN
ncbi:uncharacterized protein FIBRA_02751 [Fibroporia radiculosa]|uniref:Uncharacterized protein n=1 Tax=Fibroporia radiculosa TaxID=599839 RepID=J4I983_9APHY|nr:uncharacterized protein FIBRA_02751 [Fibroporia radiculosa]CCM00711.1 predicted protein [Fibroporia radiculosa]